VQAALVAEATFMYAMPMSETPDGKMKIFFEETSLVARSPMTFRRSTGRCVRVCVYVHVHFGYVARLGVVRACVHQCTCGG
jgi:hypothetical protein